MFFAVAGVDCAGTDGLGVELDGGWGAGCCCGESGVRLKEGRWAKDKEEIRSNDDRGYRRAAPRLAGPSTAAKAGCGLRWNASRVSHRSIAHITMRILRTQSHRLSRQQTYNCICRVTDHATATEQHIEPSLT